jgi:hypothetical protein
LLTQRVADESPEDAVFTRPNGKAVKDFRDIWAKTIDAVGVPSLLSHDLRRAGIAEGVIMKNGGWRTHSVFE